MIFKTGKSTQLVLSENEVDLEGDPISPDQEYVFFAVSMGIHDSLGIKISSPSNPLKLARISAVRNLTRSFAAGSGGMDVDADGNIYMADFGATLSGPPGTKVFRITPTGEIETFATGFIGASGNDFDDEGNLFQ